MTFFIGKLVRFIAVYGLNSYNKHSHKTPSNNKLVRKARTRFTYEEQIGACLIRFLDYARNDIEDCRNRCAPLRMNYTAWANELPILPFLRVRGRFAGLDFCEAIAELFPVDYLVEFNQRVSAVIELSKAGLPIEKSSVHHLKSFANELNISNVQQIALNFVNF